MSARPEDLLHCTFCTKSQQLVRKLIAGPGVYICDECIGLCNGIMDGEEDDLLAQLSISSARTDALVERLRAGGVPWEEIAGALKPKDGED